MRLKLLLLLVFLLQASDQFLCLRHLLLPSLLLQLQLLLLPLQLLLLLLLLLLLPLLLLLLLLLPLLLLLRQWRSAKASSPPVRGNEQCPAHFLWPLEGRTPTWQPLEGRTPTRQIAPESCVWRHKRL